MSNRTGNIGVGEGRVSSDGLGILIGDLIAILLFPLTELLLFIFLLPRALFESLNTYINYPRLLTYLVLPIIRMHCCFIKMIGEGTSSFA
jgi:hypothetical protein